MKHKISKLIITFGVLATLSACIEVKDKDEEGNVVIQTIEGGDLIVDEPLFLHEGQFLSQDAFQQIRAYAKPPQEYKIKLASLKMGPKGILYTMGNIVRLDIHYLDSMAGTIATFPEQAQAETGDGRSGGSLIIEATNAQGVLSIKLVGEAGAQGVHGPPPNFSLKGATGAKGKDGGNACLSGNNMHGTNGGDGGKGKQGFFGGKGFAGGSSGTLSLTVKNSVNFKPEVDIRPGKGGAGGFGGAGGEGGDPGPGGKKPCVKDKYWPSGAKGPQGDRGPTGPSGSDGISETACFYIQQNPMCDKKSFAYSK